MVASPNSSQYPKSILLKGAPLVGEGNAATSAAIKPGMLLERTSAADVLRKHSTAQGRAEKMFAAEEGYMGTYLDTAYVDGGRLPFYACKPGDQIYAFLATGENVAIGTYLASAGNGGLETVDSDGFAVAVALEAVNNSSGSLVRIKVEVI